MMPGDLVWHALEPALTALYAAKPEVVLQETLGPDEGGPPLSRVVVFAAETPVKHWHFVTCGLTQSRFTPGYPSAGDFELSFRVVRSAQERTSPAWVPAFLQSLARHAFEDDSPLHDGGDFDLRPFWQGLPVSIGRGYLARDEACSTHSLAVLNLIGVRPEHHRRLMLLSGGRVEMLQALTQGLTELVPASTGAPDAEAAPPSFASETAARSIASLTAEKVGGRMRVVVAPADAAPLADAFVALVRAGGLTVQGNGWQLRLSFDDTVRSATWATTVAVYVSGTLAREIAATLTDPASMGTPLRWAALPQLELLISSDHPTSTLGRWAKKLFG